MSLNCYQRTENIKKLNLMNNLTTVLDPVLDIPSFNITQTSPLKCWVQLFYTREVKRTILLLCVLGKT